MNAKELLATLEHHDGVKKIIGNKSDWIEDRSLRKKVVKLINKEVTESVAKNHELIDELIDFEKSTKRRDKEIERVENEVVKGDVYPWINENTLNRWASGESTPKRRKLNVFLIFFKPHRLSWDPSDPLDRLNENGSINQSDTLFQLGDADLKRVEGHYNMYNIDIGEKNSFQISNLTISPDSDEHTINFKKIINGKVLAINPKVSIIQQSQLLILNPEDPNFYILGFISSIMNPSLMKAILVSHGNNLVPFSSFIILEKVEEAHMQSPEREVKDIPQKISQYLVQEGGVLYPRIPKYFDREDLILKNNTDALLSFCGEWKIFSNIGSRGHKTREQKNHYIGSVRHSDLKIFFDESTGIFKCELVAEFLRGTFEGSLNFLNHKLDYFILAQLTNNEGSQINLSFNTGNESKNQLVGLFNTFNPFAPRMSTGICILERKKEDSEEEGPNPSIPNFLANYSRSRLESPVDFFRGIIENKEYQNCPYAGIYKVYSYGTSRSNKIKGIAIGYLQILPDYEVFYKKEAGSELARGRAEINRDNLIIHLRDTRINRYGAFFITTKGMYPKDRAGIIYSGIFGGFARYNQNAVGSRLILEFITDNHDPFDSLKPVRIWSNEKKYQEIPQNIRQVLSGRIRNLIGFLREPNTFNQGALQKEIDNEINFGEVFYQAAYVEAKEGNIQKSVKMIRRAVFHGFRDIHLFENSLGELVIHELIKESDKNNILEDSGYLQIKEIVLGLSDQE